MVYQFCWISLRSLKGFKNIDFISRRYNGAAQIIQLSLVLVVMKNFECGWMIIQSGYFVFLCGSLQFYFVVLCLIKFHLSKGKSKKKLPREYNVYRRWFVFFVGCFSFRFFFVVMTFILFNINFSYCLKKRRKIKKASGWVSECKHVPDEKPCPIFW